MDIGKIRKLITICYDKAQDQVTIRRCISSVFFEIILFIAHNFPCYKDEIFRNQNGVYNGISEKRFLNKLKIILYSRGKGNEHDINGFLYFMRMLEFYRTLTDHFGGFENELKTLNIARIRTFEGVKNIPSKDIPKEISREELIKILQQAENWLNFLEILF